MGKKPTYEELEKRIHELEQLKFNNKQIDDELHKEKEIVESFIKTVQIIVLILDNNGYIVSFNSQMEKISGYKLEEVAGKSWFSTFLIGKDCDHAQELFRKAISNTQTNGNTNLILTKDGREILIKWHSETLKDKNGKVIGLLAIGRDINEQRRAELSLKNSEKYFREIINGMSDWVWEVDSNGRYTYCSEKVERILGYSSEEIIGKTIFDFLTPDSIKTVRKKFDKALAEKTSIKDLENWNISKSGRYVCLLTNGVPLFDGSKNVTGFRGADRDITDKKKVEVKLREREESYHTTLNSIGDAVISTDVKGNVTYMNPVAEVLTGWNLKNSHRKQLSDIFNIVNVYTEEKVKNPIDVVLSEHRSTTIEEGTILVSKHGTHYPISDSASPIRDSFGNITGAVLVFRDMTGPMEVIKEKKLLRERFDQTQKLDALGQLAGGVAHNFNNILMGILGNITLLRLDDAVNDVYREKLEIIEQEISSASKLTRSLLGFAEGGKYLPKIYNINNIIDKSIDMFVNTRKEIIAHKSLDINVFPVKVDRSQIDQVLLNMYINSAYSMPDGGNLYIETANITINNCAINYGLSKGNYVRISITDEGCGIKKKYAHKIFEPFFSTKEHIGSGMGLASAYGIIKNHGGVIVMYSELGKGTTFSIYLPAVIDAKTENEEKLKLPCIKGNKDVIVVIDDEIFVGNAITSILQHLEYDSIFFNEENPAIDYIEKNKCNISVILLDMIMPHISAEKFLDKVKIIDKEIPVILMSGYGLNSTTESLLNKGCSGFLHKPFSMGEATKLIQRVKR